MNTSTINDCGGVFFVRTHRTHILLKKRFAEFADCYIKKRMDSLEARIKKGINCDGTVMNEKIMILATGQDQHVIHTTFLFSYILSIHH